MSIQRDWRFILGPHYKNGKGFSWIHPILERLGGHYRVILTSMKQWEYRPGLKPLLEEKLTYPYSIIETPWSWQNRRVKARAKKARVWLTSTWNSLKESKDFKSSLNYEGIPLWNILHEMFWGMFFRVLPEAVRSIEIAKNMIINEKPISIILPCEYCADFSYASLIIGQKRRIQTIAPQHGIITPYSFEYKFARAHRLPQYDTVFRFKKLLNRNRLLRALNVDPNKRVITLTTQPIPMKEVLMGTVLNAINSLKDVVLSTRSETASD